jgi:hypothetical protein
MVVIANGGTKPYSLFVNSVDIISPAGGKGGVPLDSIRLVDSGRNGQSTLEFLHKDPLKAFALPPGAEVSFYDARTGTMFGGYLVTRSLAPMASQQGRAVKCNALDYSIALDRHAVRGSWSSGTLATDTAILTGIFGWEGTGLTVASHTTTTIGANQVFAHMPMRQVVEQCQTIAQGILNVPIGYLVDAAKAMHYFKVADFSYTAPGPVTDVTSTPGGSTAVENLTLEYDESQIINSLFVRGASATASGKVDDTASIAIYGQREAIIDAPRATTLAQATQYARGYFVDRKDATLRGSFEVDGTLCYATGRHWRAENNVTITNLALGLAAAVFRVYSVDTWWLGGAGAHRHRVNFGGLPRSGLARILSALTSSGFTTLGSVALPTSGRRIVGAIG